MVFFDPGRNPNWEMLWMISVIVTGLAKDNT